MKVIRRRLAFAALALAAGRNRLRQGLEADAVRMLEERAEAWRALEAEAPQARPRPELQHLRWMIEEFRVSLFAQEMRTVLRVSEKRLSEQLEKARAEARA